MGKLMLTQEPTKEQIQWLWEQCGLHLIEATVGAEAYWTDANWFSITIDARLPVDLNNLFKYAVPKLVEDGIELEVSHHTFAQPRPWKVSLRGNIPPFKEITSTYDKDPALALFWAIYKALGGK